MSDPPPPHPSATRVPAAAAWGLLALLAGFLRFWNLDQLPPGLFRDEAEKGYNAWSIARTGAAIELGWSAEGRPEVRRRPWPLHLNIGGSTTSVIYQYCAAPFMAVFGPTPASARMAAAAAGTLTAAAAGALFLRAWGTGPGLAAMLWLTICPWHLIFSRWAAQGIFAPLFMTLTLAGSLGVERGRRWAWPVLGAGLGLAYYAYSGAQPFALAWGTLLALHHRKEARKHPLRAAAGLAAAALFAVPAAWEVFARDGGGRLEAVAVWHEPGATFGSSVAAAIRNYLAHFSPVFLFLRGDSLARHGLPDRGALFSIDAALIPLGAFWAWRRRLPLFWPLAAAVLAGPAGAAITRTGIPHALRSLPMALPLAIFAGLGIAAAAEILKPGAEAGTAPERTGTPETPGGASSGSTRRSAAGWPPGPGARRAMAAALLLAAALGAGLHLRALLNFYRDSPEARAAFSADLRFAMEMAARERRPGARVWINAYADPYAAWLALFLGRVDPEIAARGGPEAAGWIVFDPAALAKAPKEAGPRPGDWIVGFNARGKIEAGEARWSSPPARAGH